MKVFLYLFVINAVRHVFAQIINNNFNHSQLEHLKILNSNQEQVYNLRHRDRRSVYYQTYNFPSTQNHLNVPNKALNQNGISSYKKSEDTSKGYEIIKLTANENFLTLPNNKENPNIQHSSNEINNPVGRSLSRSSPSYSHTPTIDTRFSNDEEDQPPSQNHHKADYKKIDSSNGKVVNNEPANNETFQYQYNKGWSVHEAISVNEIVIPHLEKQKNSKYSTPKTPEARYYEKFYDIYSHVEHQTKQDLGNLEKESINDDFNGRSIVAPGQYPHMAAIGFLSNEEKIEFKCGGSLISKTFVITAAHCCYLNGETPIIVKLGIINLKSQPGNSDPQRRAIREIIVHPSYNSTLNYHDIALLRLQSPVEFTKFVRPILLWSSDDIPYERVFTMGYGSTSFAKAPTNILTELSLSLIPLQRCKEILPRDEKAPNGIVESQICGRDMEKNRDTCQGDSGGPLQLNFEHRQQRNKYRYYLVGIISYGEYCGSKTPGVYTRVSSYCKWIASLVWPNFET